MVNTKQVYEINLIVPNTNNIYNFSVREYVEVLKQINNKYIVQNFMIYLIYLIYRTLRFMELLEYIILMKNQFQESDFPKNHSIQSRMSFASQAKGAPLNQISFASTMQAQHQFKSSLSENQKRVIHAAQNTENYNLQARDMKKKSFQQQDQLCVQTPSAKAIPESGSISSVHALESKISSIKNFQQNVSFNLPNSKPQATFNFNYLGDFQGIQQIFISFGENQMNMNTIKKTEKKVLLQKKAKNSGICWFICFRSPQDPEVYQLEKVGSISNQASLILISGQQNAFLVFKDQFLAHLWNAQKLQVQNQEEQLNHFLTQMQSQVTIGIVKSEIEHLLNSKTKKQYQNIKQMNKKIRELQYQIIQQIQKKPNIRATHPTTLRKIEEKLYKDVKIIELYARKFYRNQSKQLTAKCNTIISKLTLKDIINHLEIQVIGDHPTFTNQLKLLGGQLQNNNTIPYYSAIEILRKLQTNSTPISLLQLIAIFHHRVKQLWHKYHQNRVKLSNMDDFLPITIYCVLLSNNENLVGILHFLMDYVEIQQELDSYAKNFDIQKKILSTLISSQKYLLEEWKKKDDI